MEEHSSSESNSSSSSSPSLHSPQFSPAPDEQDFEMDFPPDPQDATNILDEGQPDGKRVDHEPPVVTSAALLTSLGLGRQVQFFPGTSKVYGTGQIFLKRFKMDTYSIFCKINPHYPFASHNDWQMANYLLQSGLSMAKIDEYFKLNLVQSLPLSFHTAKELRNCAELLPPGPHWKYRIVAMAHPTKNLAVLYYRDSLECVELLFNHPYYTSHINYTPFCLLTTAERIVREYAKWMSSDVAWCMQSKLPEGTTLCGVVLSSDKMHITNMCGGKVTHPLLISLANIRMAVRNKASLHAFLLGALMPIAEFLHPKQRMCSVLDARLFHQCLDIVIEPLKIAACIGHMMSDPAGNLQHCFTPLTAYIADTPEACMLVCVRGKTSPVMMVSYKEFSNAFQHEQHTWATTLAQLAHITCDLNDVERYFTQCKQFRLSRVYEPFWRDWPLSDPPNFLSPEALHHWHGKFWDHDPIVGLRHFKNGITTLKQVTGCAKCDVQRYIVPVISGAAPTNTVIAICALMDFRYLAQARVITSSIHDKIKDALAKFHEHKFSITNKGLQRGAKSGAALNHWQIPKLEFMQSVGLSISQLGAPVQWSADMTKHTHIEVVKDPAASTNHHHFDSQICRYLDQMEKCRAFETATRLSSLLHTGVAAGDMDDPDEDPEEHPMALLNDIWALKRPIPNFFAIAESLLTVAPGSIPYPIHTFTSGLTTFRLNYDPSIKHIVTDKVAEMFNIPDLCPAITDYLGREGPYAQNFHSFGGP
ncbi:hypothetical protein PAXINDRAFT_15770 [Paxillus involutus ATCC 200175]|uniref:DUF6830 domain-containing protein n=1 Tax=Paxillus involutus ATCC 200175 TaxID=664439 RepID=A0A0C9TKU8_PAXIN|nr:hypothetical protein PAXINDRAFT_15770 [Paxillus involutus ATCC 200175]